MIEWKQINEAPKDRRILLCSDKVMACGRWVDTPYQRGWRLDDGKTHEVQWFAEVQKP